MLLGLGFATLAAVAAVTACLTDPPPDLPLQSQSPTIEHPALRPPEGTITSLPTRFVVPIQIADPSLPCLWSVYDEYTTYFPCKTCDTTWFDAGVVTIDFSLAGQSFDTTRCDTLRFTVGSSFSAADQQCHSGNDVATWDYRPANGSCVTYDAGALEDGAFPEASTDALPIVPDSAGDP
jgi:hypothetical protein